MSYLGRKSDKALSAIGGGKDGIKNLKMHLKNAYDEIDRLNEVLTTKDGLDFFIFLLYNFSNKPNRKRTKIGR